MEIFNKISIFCENFLEVVSKMPYSWENPMKLASSKPSVMVAKGKISFATILGFSQYIYENGLNYEDMNFPMILAKKSQFHFSFFKVDSQNPKFSLEYLCPASYCNVLHLTAMYCILLHCTAFYCTVLHLTPLHCILQRCTASYCTALYPTELYCILLHCTTLCHSCLKVHGGVPIVLCIFWDPLVRRINCLVIRD